MEPRKKKEMPSSLKAKFFEGVEETAEEKGGVWKAEIELRPARLGLGAESTKPQKKETNKAERRVANMIKQADDSSDDDFRGLSKK